MSADTDQQPTPFHKTVISMVVLSKEPIQEEMDIDELVDLEADGGCVMNVTGESSRAIGGPAMEDELELAGHPAGLFRADRNPQMQRRDWLDELSGRQVNDLARQVIDEDRISPDSLRRLLRETGIAAEEAPAHERPEEGS